MLLSKEAVSKIMPDLIPLIQGGLGKALPTYRKSQQPPVNLAEWLASNEDFSIKVLAFHVGAQECMDAVPPAHVVRRKRRGKKSHRPSSSSTPRTLSPAELKKEMQRQRTKSLGAKPNKEWLGFTPEAFRSVALRLNSNPPDNSQDYEFPAKASSLKEAPENFMNFLETHPQLLNYYRRRLTDILPVAKAWNDRLGFPTKHITIYLDDDEDTDDATQPVEVDTQPLEDTPSSDEEEKKGVLTKKETPVMDAVTMPAKKSLDLQRKTVSAPSLLAAASSKDPDTVSAHALVKMAQRKSKRRPNAKTATASSSASSSTTGATGKSGAQPPIRYVKKLKRT